MINIFFRSISPKCKDYFILLTSVCVLFFFTACNVNREFLSANLQEQMSKKRAVQNADSREEFQITLKTLNPKKKHTYYWFRSGNINKSVSHYDGYLLDNTYSKFNTNSGLLEKGLYVKGLKTSTWRTWYNNGREAVNTQYKKGFKQGVFLIYDSIGNITKKGHYKKGLKRGAWYVKGKGVTKTTYKKGIKHGQFSDYDSIGNMTKKGRYKKGLKNGSWYTNEKDITKITYKKGIKHGAFSSYDDKGNSIEKGHYDKDVKTGEWIRFIKKDTLYYKAGKVIPKDSIKPSFLSRMSKKVFKKKNDTNTKTNKTTIRKKGVKNTSKKRSNKKQTPKPKATKKASKIKHEEGFFGRLFKKKDKKNK